MKRINIILPLFVGTFVYCVVSVCVGPRGLWPMSQLENERIRLGSNLSELHAINDDLDSQFKNLTADPDTIQVYAHELGYVANGEKLIKLAGFSGGINRKLVAGNAQEMAKPAYMTEWLCKTFGLITGILAFFLFSFFRDRRNLDSEKKLA
jgi:cell division protein FtsB